MVFHLLLIYFHLITMIKKINNTNNMNSLKLSAILIASTLIFIIIIIGYFGIVGLITDIIALLTASVSVALAIFHKKFDKIFFTK